MTIEVELSLYVVRNKEGKYFRAKGYGGYGNTWVDDINKCKVYGKIGSARRTVTWFSNHYPEFGVPDLVELKVKEGIVLDETERVQKAKDKKEREKLNNEIYRAEREMEKAQEKIDNAQKAKNDYEEAKRKLEELNAKK